MRYARHLLEPCTRARLVAVCRRNAAQGAAFAADHSLRFYPDYRELVVDPAVQAVVVVTPPSLTREICLEAVRARKPMMIEKPLATSGREGRTMVEAAESAGVPLMTAQTLRFDSAVQALKLQTATVGSRCYLVLTNRMEPVPDGPSDGRGYAGRGVLLEIGVHQLDLVRFLTGEEVSEVWCDMERDQPERPESKALVKLRTTGGLPCILDVSRVTAGRVGRAEWVGTEGQVIADWNRHRLCRISSRTTADEWTVEDQPTVVEALRAFVEALDHGVPMPITGLDGLRALEIADACYESAAAGRAVRLVR
jgi:predicted dehydrogenase